MRMGQSRENRKDKVEEKSTSEGDWLIAEIIPFTVTDSSYSILVYVRMVPPQRSEGLLKRFPTHYHTFLEMHPGNEQRQQAWLVSVVAIISHTPETTFEICTHVAILYPSRTRARAVCKHDVVQKESDLFPGVCVTRRF
jgi:hypothetical protein